MPWVPNGHPSPLRPVLLGAAVVASVVAGHGVVYATEYPDAPTRAAHLAATGHGYWPVAVILGSSAVLVALLAAATAGAAGTNVVPGTRVFVATACVAYALLETVERVVAHAPVADLVPGGELAVGLAIQIAVALLVALALQWVARVAARVAAHRVQQLLPGTIDRGLPPARTPTHRRCHQPAAARAPPTLRGTMITSNTRRMETELCDAS